MPIRRRFVVALIALAVLVAGWLAAPSAQRAWAAHQHEERMKPYAAAIALMLEIPTPADTTLCATREQLRDSGVMCWHRKQLPVRATAELAAALRKVGASEVKPRCVSGGRMGARCTISARLGGVAYRAYLTSAFAGADRRIVGSEQVSGVDLEAIPSHLPAFPAIPVPTLP